jgi:hypothetical protein
MAGALLVFGLDLQCRNSAKGVCMRLAKMATILFAALFLAAEPAPAQTATGEVNGTVTDKSSGFVAGATVKLSNQDTKIEDRATTNSDGYFVFINVKPGTYILGVEAKGFKITQIAPFGVGVNQTVTQTIRLEVGAITDQVVVNAEAVMLEGSTSDLGTVIEEKAVNDLPLNGRNFTQLLTLTPGVTPVSTAQNKSIGCCEGNVGIPGSGFSDASFHGQENRSKLYFFDGIINTNIRGPTYIVIPNIDLVQEFKVVGHDAKAEYGGATGGVVDMVSKSGTNSFHGSVFEYVRNNAFDARNTFTDFNSLTTAPTSPLAYHQNQFGAQVGGPIIKNKTFISGGYDGWRYSKPSQSLTYVPTAAELSGDFSQTLVSNPNLYNPYSTVQTGPTTFTRSRFMCDASGVPIPAILTPGPTFGTQPVTANSSACNKIPTNLINPAMQGFLQKYSPAPNLTGVPGFDYQQNRAETNNSNSFQVRVDHRFRSTDNVFFRYTEQRVSAFTPIGDTGSTSGGSQGRNYGGAWVHTFKPNLILDLRAGYAGRPAVDAGQQNQSSLGTGPMKQLGFKDIDKYGGMLVNLANDWTAGTNSNFGTRGAAPRENPNWSVTPNLSWIKGNHNLKTGFWFIDSKRVQLNTFQTFNFTRQQTGDPSQSAGKTGLTLASALLALPGSFSAQLPVLHGGPVRYKYAAWAAYVQDEWKIKPRITVSLGLRYDYLTQPQTTDGRLWSTIDVTNKQYVIGASTMPPHCSQAQQSPCIPDGAPLYTPTNSACNNKAGGIPCDFTQDPHFSSVVLAGQSFFDPPPIKDNWGPRAGVAWQVTLKTVLRAGYGLYWDTLSGRGQAAQNDLEHGIWPDATAFSGDVNAPLDFSGGTSKLITAIQGNFPTPLPGPTPWTAGGFALDPHKYKDGYSQQWQGEVQREITPNLMVSAAYVGSKNGRLDYEGKANSAQFGSPAVTDAVITTPQGVTTCGPAATAACKAAYLTSIDALRAMPWANPGFTYAETIGYSNYNALEARVNRRFANGLQSLVSYTFSKSIDVSSGYFGVENGNGGGSAVQNFYDQRTARGVSGFDITHFLSWFTVYEFPFGHGKKRLHGGPLSWIVGDWQGNYIFQARSGQPYTLRVTGDVANLTGTGGVGAQNFTGYGRPNIVSNPFQAGPVAANPDPKCQLTISQGGKAADQVYTAHSWFNPCAFTVPDGFGNLGRDAYRGQPVYNVDFSMFKSFPLPREGMSLQLRFESFNVFNIQNWDTPTTQNSDSGLTVGNKAFGRITTLAHDPRQLQFGLRFTF